MRIDYDVGDVVVCVDDAPVEGDCRPTGLREGFLYRVLAFHDEWPSVIVSARHDGGGHWLWRFKKLPKADEDFTAYMRKMKPKQTEKPRCPLTGEPLTVQERFEQECG